MFSFSRNFGRMEDRDRDGVNTLLLFILIKSNWLIAIDFVTTLTSFLSSNWPNYFQLVSIVTSILVFPHAKAFKLIKMFFFQKSINYFVKRILGTSRQFRNSFKLSIAAVFSIKVPIYLVTARSLILCLTSATSPSPPSTNNRCFWQAHLFWKHIYPITSLSGLSFLKN